jgi:hypothetical protein
MNTGKPYIRFVVRGSDGQYAGPEIFELTAQAEQARLFDSREVAERFRSLLMPGGVVIEASIQQCGTSEMIDRGTTSYVVRTTSGQYVRKLFPLGMTNLLGAAFFFPTADLAGKFLRSWVTEDAEVVRVKTFLEQSLGSNPVGE